MKFPDIPQIYSLYRESPVVITDSRNVVPGSIFFALKGDNFNGNAFAASAIEKGCSYAVIDDEKYYQDQHCVLVKDVLHTIQELAKFHRGKLKIPIIAITGSNGKTTTKELAKAVLSKKYNTLATRGNLNNHIGVPLTLLSITSQIEIAVIEMGANHLGEIALLCKIANPDYGIITNIGKAHIGEFGSFENIVKAKTEMYEHIRAKNEKIFINSDNDLLMHKAEGMEKITYGTSENNFSQCELLEANPNLQVRFEGITISSNLIGGYNFENISAVLCIGKYFGVSAKQMKEAVEEYVPSDNRSQIVRTKTNTLILDAYNANPSSMKVAIENFSAMSGLEKWVILGDMLELGEYELEEHQTILKQLRDMGIRNVILVGGRFFKAAETLKVLFSKILIMKNTEELVEMLQSNSPIKSSSLVLIKGSRGMKLEKAVEYL